jgi:hypothetical protein
LNDFGTSPGEFFAIKAGSRQQEAIGSGSSG